MAQQQISSLVQDCLRKIESFDGYQVSMRRLVGGSGGGTRTDFFAVGVREPVTFFRVRCDDQTEGVLALMDMIVDEVEARFEMLDAKSRERERRAQQRRARRRLQEHARKARSRRRGADDENG